MFIPKYLKCRTVTDYLWISLFLFCRHHLVFYSLYGIVFYIFYISLTHSHVFFIISSMITLKCIGPSTPSCLRLSLTFCNCSYINGVTFYCFEQFGLISVSSKRSHICVLVARSNVFSRSMKDIQADFL